MEHFLSSDLNCSMEISQGCGDSRFCSSEGLQQAYAVCSVTSEGYLGQGHKSRSEMESSADAHL